MTPYSIVKKNEFIKKSISKDEAYDMWLARIDIIEKSTIHDSSDYEISDSLNIVYMLFPIIDSVSYTLFNKNGRTYLKKLGYSDGEADVMFSTFRNGHLHNGSNYRLVYDDGVVSWGMSSSSGSGGFMPFDEGYSSEEYPDLNQPAERPFEYIEFEENDQYHASLSLDRLAAQIRHDLIKRKARDSRNKIDIIVGQRIYHKRRLATKFIKR